MNSKPSERHGRHVRGHLRKGRLARPGEGLRLGKGLADADQGLNRPCPRAICNLREAAMIFDLDQMQRIERYQLCARHAR